ncbi:MAG: ecdysteroid 22-kinase family protein [Sphingomonadaceae bacterium]|nr:ecdysteroid 22-kinase family protein [Sphingomonadaceae bacterium]
MPRKSTVPDQPACTVPASVEEALDPTWLSMALAAVSGGAAVTCVEQVEYIKTMATKIRFVVSFEGSQEQHAFCIKGLLDIDEGNKTLGTSCVAEADFFCKIAPRLQLRVPDCVSAVIDRDEQQAVIIMRDLVVEGKTFCNALDVFTADDAASALEQLSLLHRNSQILKDESWIGPRSIEISRLAAFTPEVLQRQLDDPRGDNLSAEVRSGANLVAAVRTLADRSEMRPQFMLHGDLHAGNIYRTTEGLGLIDWQVLQRGGWALDLAYHINAVLPTKIAEVEERRLLDEYLQRMRAAGIDMPDDETAWTQYREAVAYGLFMWGITRRVDPPIIVMATDRLGKAAMRHETFKLLGVT